jgi:uncharacterized protein YegP (UPF0339 family)
VAAKFELFKDKAGEYRWRLRHQNGNVIADSAEGYSTKSAALNGIESVKNNITLADIKDMSSEVPAGSKGESGAAAVGSAPQPATGQIMQSEPQQKSADKPAVSSRPSPETAKSPIAQPEVKPQSVSASIAPKRTANPQSSDLTIIGVLILAAWFVILIAVAVAGTH